MFSDTKRKVPGQHLGYSQQKKADDTYQKCPKCHKQVIWLYQICSIQPGSLVCSTCFYDSPHPDCRAVNYRCREINFSL